MLVGQELVLHGRRNVSWRHEDDAVEVTQLKSRGPRRENDDLLGRCGTLLEVQDLVVTTRHRAQQQNRMQFQCFYNNF